MGHHSTVPSSEIMPFPTFLLHISRCFSCFFVRLSPPHPVLHCGRAMHSQSRSVVACESRKSFRKNLEFSTVFRRIIAAFSTEASTCSCLVINYCVFRVDLSCGRRSVKKPSAFSWFTVSLAVVKWTFNCENFLTARTARMLNNFWGEIFCIFVHFPLLFGLQMSEKAFVCLKIIAYSRIKCSKRKVFYV